MKRYKFILAVFFVVMVIGNALRFLPISKDLVAIGSVNTTEMFFYLVSIVVLFLTPKYILRFPLEYLGIYACFLLSFLIASIRLQEVPFLPLSHNIRVLLYFLSTYVVGLTYYKLYHNDLIKLLNFILKIFVINVIVAWVLYLVFPTAVHIWDILQGYGIMYDGDYNLNRLLGTTFDPNFFGNILIFPIMMSLFLIEKTEKKIYFFTFLFFAFSIMFTVSRSSLLGLSIALVLYHLISLKMFITKFKIKKSLLFNLVIFIAAIVGIIILSPEQAERYFNRFFGISTDLSARHRYNDMMLAFDLLSDYETLIRGIGFNFFRHLKLTSLSTIDSSILTILVSLGVPMFTVVIALFVKLFKFIRPTDPLLLAFYRQVFLIYLVASLVICNFNNLLFFVYWVFWVLPFISYFYLFKKEKRNYATGN